MRSVLTVTILSSIIVALLISCSGAGGKKVPDTLAVKTRVIKFEPIIGDGQKVANKMGCMNCHLYGSGHMINSLHPEKKVVPNMHDLCATDSMKIVKFAFKNGHLGYYKTDPQFKNITNRDIRNLIYYLHSCNQIQP